MMDDGFGEKIRAETTVNRATRVCAEQATRPMLKNCYGEKKLGRHVFSLCVRDGVEFDDHLVAGSEMANRNWSTYLKYTDG